MENPHNKKVEDLLCRILKCVCRPIAVTVEPPEPPEPVEVEHLTVWLDLASAGTEAEARIIDGTGETQAMVVGDTYTIDYPLYSLDIEVVPKPSPTNSEYLVKIPADEDVFSTETLVYKYYQIKSKIFDTDSNRADDFKNTFTVLSDKVQVALHLRRPKQA